MQTADTSYGPVAKTFHWVIASMILVNLVLIFSVPEQNRQPIDFQIVDWHKAIGVTVLVLALARLIWRWSHPVPDVDNLAAWQRILATVVHYALYAVMVVMPLMGFLASLSYGVAVNMFGLFTIPVFIPVDKPMSEVYFGVHVTLQYALYGLLFLHVGAALYHHFLRGDDVLRRMTPGAGPVERPISARQKA